MNGILHRTFAGSRSASGRNAVAALALLGAVLVQPAHADQVAPTTLVAPESVFFEGAGASTVLTLNTTGAGTVSVNVNDYEFPVALSSLSFSAASQTQVLKTETQANPATDFTFTFNVGSAGAFYAQISALAGASQFAFAFPSIGGYSLDVTFSPAQVSAVPLPPAVWLLVAGFLGIAAFSWVRRQRGLSIPLPLGPTPVG